MTRNQKAIAQLESIDIDAIETNGTVYVCVGDVELELAEYEIEYRAKEHDKTQLFEEYDFRNFTNVDPDETGVEISQDGETLGSIYDISIPDENDEEETNSFIRVVNEWLENN